jgi:2-succinyl-6-hydroxy-2,4-cyclohexadiene-1-carboxylate synthase
MRVNGVDLHVEVDGQGPPLLLLHGFTGSARAWDELTRSLRDQHTVIRVDALGHGLSAHPSDPARYRLEAASADLEAVLDALGHTRVDLLGYSMGGRQALHLAVHSPQRINRLILESATPGVESTTERAARIAADEALAERIERQGVPVFVDHWEQLPLLQLAAHVPASVRQRQHQLRLRNDPLGLANSLRGAGTGRQEPLWSALPELRLPVTLVAGQLDERYCTTAERMRNLLPRAHCHLVPHAGHTVHLDQPALFTSLVTMALDDKLT